MATACDMLLPMPAHVSPPLTFCPPAPTGRLVWLILLPFTLWAAYSWWVLHMAAWPHGAGTRNLTTTSDQGTALCAHGLIYLLASPALRDVRSLPPHLTACRFAVILSGIFAFLMFGIDEIGVQIEEPFGCEACRST